MNTTWKQVRCERDLLELLERMRIEGLIQVRNAAAG